MPEEFLWGAATSAHQVEGNNINNDWWEWEHAHPGRPISGVACDHFNRYRDDFALAKSLEHNAHRLSVEWARIEPQPGQWSRAAINHYREVLQELRRLDIKTFVTLHHFTNPAWLAHRGGWTNNRTPELFERYVDYVAQHLGDLVDFWITINEPMVYATQSYWRALWPPQEHSLFKMLRVIRLMARAHRLAYQRLHQLTPNVPISFAKHVVAYLPEALGQIDDQVVAKIEDDWFNHRFFRMIGQSFDFVAVNYYFTHKLRVHLFPPQLQEVPWNGAKSDLNWPIEPKGLTHALLHMKRYKKPIYITENGLADAADSKRADFIRAHLRAVEAAQAQGADVRGYLHWSLLDNFEWEKGFTPRFGLIEVDYKTMERRVRPSAYVYKAIIEHSQNRQ